MQSEIHIVLYSAFHTMDSGFQELDSRFFVSRTGIPLIPEFRINGILDLLSCLQDSKEISRHPDAIAWGEDSLI